jgi:succinate dehydrogenase/fumarate reductase flavoprotein subunit
MCSCAGLAESCLQLALPPCRHWRFIEDHLQRARLQKEGANESINKVGSKNLAHIAHKLELADMPLPPEMLEMALAICIKLLARGESNEGKVVWVQ